MNVVYVCLPIHNFLTRAKETHDFNIDTTGTFSGMTLKSVTEGNQANRNKGGSGYRGSGGGSGPGNATPGQNTPGSGTPKTGSASPGQPNQSGKRPSRTPIIIIPAAPKSLVTMYNAKELMQVNEIEMRSL